MILGLGSDIVDIRRIEATLDRFGDKFLARIFTEAERARAERRAGDPRVRAGTYAKRFAAKEAASKALGTGFRHGVFWRDLAVVNLSGGKPTMQFSGGAAARLLRLTPPGLAAAIELSLTDEYPYAQAMVLISAVPAAASGVDSGAKGALQAAPIQVG
jgi:holo-[acyl-carrier protein] synthase